MSTSRASEFDSSSRGIVTSSLLQKVENLAEKIRALPRYGLRGNRSYTVLTVEKKEIPLHLPPKDGAGELDCNLKEILTRAPNIFVTLDVPTDMSHIDRLTLWGLRVHDRNLGHKSFAKKRIEILFHNGQEQRVSAFSKAATHTCGKKKREEIVDVQTGSRTTELSVDEILSEVEAFSRYNPDSGPLLESLNGEKWNIRIKRGHIPSYIYRILASAASSAKELTVSGTLPRSGVFSFLTLKYQRSTVQKQNSEVLTARRKTFLTAIPQAGASLRLVFQKGTVKSAEFFSDRYHDDELKPKRELMIDYTFCQLDRGIDIEKLSTDLTTAEFLSTFVSRRKLKRNSNSRVALELDQICYLYDSGGARADEIELFVNKLLKNVKSFSFTTRTQAKGAVTVCGQSFRLGAWSEYPIRVSVENGKVIKIEILSPHQGDRFGYPIVLATRENDGKEVPVATPKQFLTEVAFRSNDGKESEQVKIFWRGESFLFYKKRSMTQLERLMMESLETEDFAIEARCSISGVFRRLNFSISCAEGNSELGEYLCSGGTRIDISRGEILRVGHFHLNDPSRNIMCRDLKHAALTTDLNPMELAEELEKLRNTDRSTVSLQFEWKQAIGITQVGIGKPNLLERLFYEQLQEQNVPYVLGWSSRHTARRIEQSNSQGRIRVIRNMLLGERPEKRPGFSPFIDLLMKADLPDLQVCAAVPPTRNTVVLNTESVNDSSRGLHPIDRLRLTLPHLRSREAWDTVASCYTMWNAHFSSHLTNRVVVLYLGQLAREGVLSMPETILSAPGGSGDFFKAVQEMRGPLKQFAQRTPAVHLLDYSSAMLAFAGYPFSIQADMEALPFADDSREAIECSSPHRLVDIHSCLREMHRVLVPGGILLLKVEKLYFSNKFKEGLQKLGFDIIGPFNARIKLPEDIFHDLSNELRVKVQIALHNTHVVIAQKNRARQPVSYRESGQFQFIGYRESKNPIHRLAVLLDKIKRVTCDRGLMSNVAALSNALEDAPSEWGFANRVAVIPIVERFAQRILKSTELPERPEQIEELTSARFQKWASELQNICENNIRTIRSDPHHPTHIYLEHLAKAARTLARSVIVSG